MHEPCDGRPLDDPFDSHVASLDRLLASYLRAPAPSAAKAFKAAIRRHGAEILDVDGVEGMRKASAPVSDVDPEDSRRAAILDAARAGLPGWSGDAT